jgi:predicted DNA-binding transcriptional regulator YafY
MPGPCDSGLSDILRVLMNRLERLYAISEHLRRHAPAPVSAQSMAQRFEVNRRTIERDLAALREAGVALSATRGSLGGVRLETSGRALLVLTPAELAALLLAATLAGDMPFAGAAKTATGKLAEALPSAARVQVERLRQRIQVVPDGTPNASARVRTVLEEALRSSRVVRLGYTDRLGQHSERDVEPVGFYYGAGGWALVGWCRQRQDGRFFRLHRIRHAELTTETAPDRDYAEVLGYIPDPGVRPSWDYANE